MCKILKGLGIQNVNSENVGKLSLDSLLKQIDAARTKYGFCFFGEFNDCSDESELEDNDEGNNDEVELDEEGMRAKFRKAIRAKLQEESKVQLLILKKEKTSEMLSPPKNTLTPDKTFFVCSKC